LLKLLLLLQPLSRRGADNTQKVHPSLGSNYSPLLGYILTVISMIWHGCAKPGNPEDKGVVTKRGEECV